MLQQSCLSDDDLRSWLLGQLDDETSERISTHLAECRRCEETVASFDETSDSLMHDVRAAVSNTDSPESNGQSSDHIQQSLRKIVNPWQSLTPDKGDVTNREFLRDYELLTTLGTGGMGTVYKAVHTRLQRMVAIKLLPARRLRDCAAVNRFEREMQAIGRLDHPAIVRATDAGEIDGTHYLAMDYVNGIDLSRLVRATGRLSVANACEVIRQAAIGLQYAHDQGLIHRDVKPSNLMVEAGKAEGKRMKDEGNQGCDKSAADDRASSVVKILDLGLALFGSASEAVDELTTVGQLMGTLDYMAPEQADNSHDVDARADVYSLGATMFKLLTGTAPYETPEMRSPLKKMKALATVDAVPVRSRAADVPDDAAQIVDRMLQRDPAARFQSAKEVAAAVVPFCADHDLGTIADDAIARVEEQARSDVSVPRLPEKPPSLSDNVPQVAIEVPDGSAGASGQKQHPESLLSTQAVRHGGWLRVVWTALSFLFLVVAGSVIWVVTDTGTLKIECIDDDVPIQIRQSNETVTSLTLQTGANEVTLRSGRYEIVLPPEYDSLTINNEVFEITRGGRQTVRITHLALASTESGSMIMSDHSAPAYLPVDPKSMPQFQDPIDAINFTHLTRRYAVLLQESDTVKRQHEDLRQTLGDSHPRVVAAKQRLMEVRTSTMKTLDEMQNLLKLNEMYVEQARATAESAQPLFEGEPFDHWKAILDTERSPSELGKAVMALCILARGNRETDATREVFSVINSYPCDVGEDTPESKLVTTAIRYIRRLDPANVEPVLVEQLTARDGYAVDHVFAGLLNTATGPQVADQPHFPVGSHENLTRYLSQSTDFRSTVIETFSSLTRAQQYDALKWLPEYGAFPELDGPLLALLENMLDLEDAYLVRCAARRIAHIVPRADLVAPLMNQLTTAAEDGRQLDAELIATWQALYALRDHLAGSVEQLMRLSLGGLRDAVAVRVTMDNDADPRRGAVIYLSQRMLQIELLAAIGPMAAPALEMISSEIEAMGGQRPVDGGPFEFRPGRLDLVIAHSIDASFLANTFPPREQLGSAAQHRYAVDALNSSLIAWERITGHPPQFSSSEFRHKPAQQRREHDVLLNGMEGAPTLNKYRNKSLDAWLASEIADVDDMDELIAVATAVRLMSVTPEQTAKSFPWMSDALSRLIELSAQRPSIVAFLKQRPGEFFSNSRGAPIYKVLEWCYEADSSKTVSAMTKLFDQSDDATKYFLLQEVAMPGTNSTAKSSAEFASYSEWGTALRTDKSAAARFDALRGRWKSLPENLKQAILRLEIGAESIADSATLPLLIQLLNDVDDTYHLEAAYALALMPDVPEELKPRITKVLTDIIEQQPSLAAVINSVVGLAVLWPDELPEKDVRRLLGLLTSDLALTAPDACQLDIDVRGKRDPVRLTAVSRRILLAEMIGTRCVSSSTVRREIAEQLAAAAGEAVESGEAGWQVLDFLLEAAAEAAIFGNGSPATRATEHNKFQFVLQAAINSLSTQ
jgi:serine/threonine protein kinase